MTIRSWGGGRSVGTAVTTLQLSKTWVQIRPVFVRICFIRESALRPYVPAMTSAQAKQLNNNNNKKKVKPVKNEILHLLTNGQVVVNSAKMLLNINKMWKDRIKMNIQLQYYYPGKITHTHTHKRCL